MNIWAAFFLVLSVVVLASPLLFGPGPSRVSSDKGRVGDNGSKSPASDPVQDAQTGDEARSVNADAVGTLRPEGTDEPLSQG